MNRAVVTCVLLALVACGQLARAQARDDLESKIKAAFLFNFLKFVEWPEGSAPVGAAPYVLCVVDSADFTAVLEQTVRDKRVDDHPVSVRGVSRGQPTADCHVVYLARAARDQGEEVLRDSGGALTVHEASAATPSGVIRFFVSDNHVRFEINVAAAESRRLYLHSSLLGVAERVRVGPPS
ncbi:MAG TPA: YfiR family protein [Nevskiaceae bacterium]|nr:YfiR family protein [Nevskiaceae bacterium]